MREVHPESEHPNDVQDVKGKHGGTDVMAIRQISSEFGAMPERGEPAHPPQIDRHRRELVEGSREEEERHDDEPI